MVADKSWIPWEEQVIPNVAFWVREWVMAKGCKEHAQKVCEEAVQEAKHITQREPLMEEQLEAFMDGKMTEEEFEWDLEAEVEVEGDKVMGTEELKETGRMEALVMEVDKDGESKVVAIEEKRKGSGQKCAPLSLPKAPRKRVYTMTATQSQAGSQLQARSMGSTGTQCKWCVWQGIMCMAVDRGMRCANCKVKHYRYLLVAVKELLGGKGSLVGSQTVKVAAGSQTRGKAKRGKGAKGATLRSLVLDKWVSLPPIQVII